MDIRPATPEDAEAIAALIRSFADLIVEDPAAAAPFWASMSAAAHASNLRSARFRYTVAQAGGELLGYIAMRDGSHLFNLFVRAHDQRRGIARALWQQALRELDASSAELGVTVNASLNAVAVYEALGFREAGAAVHTQGIAFVPMRFAMPAPGAGDAAAGGPHRSAPPPPDAAPGGGGPATAVTSGPERKTG